MQGAIFAEMAERLHQFDCVMPDLPGHGANSDLEPSLDRSSEMVAELVQSFGDQKPVILGWSMGAAAAWRYISQNGSQDIAGLITIDMSPKTAPAEDWPCGLKGQTQSALEATQERFDTQWEDAIKGIAKTMFAPGEVDEALREHVLAVIRSNDPDQMRAFWKDLVANDARSSIGKIEVPYLVCSGRQSRVYPASASEWIASNALLAKRYIFENAGHSPHLESPDEFAQVVADFCEGL